MDLKKVFTAYGITQEELAAFMHIPRGRIAMWLKDNRVEPPKQPDANIYKIAVNFFTTLDPKEVKLAIKNYHIVGLNIEPIGDFKNKGAKKYTQSDAAPTIANEPDLSYDATNEKNTLNSSINYQDMKELAPLFESIRLLAESNKKLADTNSELVTMMRNEQSAKSPKAIAS